MYDTYLLTYLQPVKVHTNVVQQTLRQCLQYHFTMVLYNVLYNRKGYCYRKMSPQLAY